MAELQGGWQGQVSEEDMQTDCATLRPQQAHGVAESSLYF